MIPEDKKFLNELCYILEKKTKLKRKKEFLELSKLKISGKKLIKILKE